MHATVTITSSLPPAALGGRLDELSGPGPFRVQDLTPLGSGEWAFTLGPRRTGLAVGFAKLAELLVLLAREFHVEKVDRITIIASSPAAPVAAAGRGATHT